MKKFLISRYDDIYFAALFFGTIFVTFQRSANIRGQPNYPFVLGLLALSVIFALVVSIRMVKRIFLKEHQVLRYWLYPLYSVLTILYLAYLYNSSNVGLIKVLNVYSIWMYIIIGFSIVRASIWLYKRHQAKKALSAPKIAELPSEDSDATD